jgi:hypothetical protein
MGSSDEVTPAMVEDAVRRLAEAPENALPDAVSTALTLADRLSAASDFVSSDRLFRAAARRLAAVSAEWSGRAHDAAERFACSLRRQGRETEASKVVQWKEDEDSGWRAVPAEVRRRFARVQEALQHRDLLFGVAQKRDR